MSKPIKKKTPKKNYAFVDNANVTVSVARQGRHIDRGKLKGRLERRWNVEKVFMLMGYHPDYESMYEYFRSLGYELVFKPMNIGENIELKGNIDTDLVLRVMKERTKYDKAILLTGDGDFLSLVNHLKDKNKLGQIIVPHSGRYSHFLEEAAGEYITSLTGKKRWLAYVKGQGKSAGGKKKADTGNEETKKPQEVVKKVASSSNSTETKKQNKKPDSKSQVHQKTKTQLPKKPERNEKVTTKTQENAGEKITIPQPAPEKKKNNNTPSRKENSGNTGSPKKRRSSSFSKTAKPKNTTEEMRNKPKESASPGIKFPQGSSSQSNTTPKENTKKSFSSAKQKRNTPNKKTKVDPSHNTRFFD